MGCFPACFGTPKLRKHRKWANQTTSGDQSHEVTEAFQPTALAKQEDIENPVNPITESKLRLEEQSNSSGRKKVNFDLNIKTNDEPSTNNEEKENEKEEERGKESKSFSGLIASSVYQNCADLDEEYEDGYLVESDLDDDDEVGNVDSLVQEESSESLFSLSIDSRKKVSATETGEKEVNSPAPVRTSPDEELKKIGSNPIVRDRTQSVHLVLKTIENLTPLKAVQAKKTNPLENQAKENIAVDTSLSSWLVESEFTPKSTNSCDSVGNLPSEKANSRRNLEDRTVLAALTVAELKQFTTSTSPKRSKSRSPDDKLIIGTVGSYWSHTGQSMDSDSSSSCREMNKIGCRNKEDEKVKWNSSPFEARMERALSEV